MTPALARAPWSVPGPPAVSDVPSESPDPRGTSDLPPDWCFTPPSTAEAPRSADGTPARSPSAEIDAFLDARITAAGLRPNPIADDPTLLRRLSFDLTGLPPTPDDIDAWRRDPGPERYSRLVDRLLSRTAFGERFARHWLDVVRYAETAGFERDEEKPHAWRYRDYVIRAFDADVPFDRFLREQLAGDLLDDVTPDSLIATGVYRLGPWDSEPNDQALARYDELDDVLRVIGEGVMGVTLGCARCHDHKSDPISQRDYYRMLAFVHGVSPYAPPRYGVGERLGAVAAIDATEERVARWRRQKRDRLQQVDALIAELRGRARERLEADRANQPPRVQAALGKSASRLSEMERWLLEEAAARHVTPEERRETFRLQEQMKEIAASFEGTALTWALVVSDDSAPEPTHVLSRGEPHAPLEAVTAGFPTAFDPDTRDGSGDGDRDLAARRSDAASPTAGDRRALAEWLTGPDHPTTGRVAVNRVWQALFGRGLVSTPNDLGAGGDPPSHPELLDWLAVRFVANGWSVKDLVRWIVHTEAYRRSSRADDPLAVQTDPDNRLLWRQNLRRLDAEEVWDAALSISGELDRAVGGPPFHPTVDAEALAGMSRPGAGLDVTPASQQRRRAIYSFVKRGLPVPLFEVLDAPPPVEPVGRRASTTTASQALSLSNGPFLNQRARAFAERVAREAGGEASRRVDRAFELALARAPTPEERAIATRYLESAGQGFATMEPALRLAPAVPSRLADEFLASLAPTDLLEGPRDGWTYTRGAFGNPYNETSEVDLERGPAALRDGVAPVDGVLAGGMTLGPGAALAAVVMRAEPGDDGDAGVQVVFDPVVGEVRVTETPRPGAPATVVARAAIDLPREVRLGLRVQWAGPRVVVEVDGAAALRAEVSRVQPGSFGLRAWGGDVSFHDLRLVVDGDVHPLSGDDPGPPGLRALESFCLLLLNLNEFLYVG